MPGPAEPRCRLKRQSSKDRSVCLTVEMGKDRPGFTHGLRIYDTSTPSALSLTTDLNGEGNLCPESEVVDTHAQQLLNGLQERLYDTVAAFLCDYPDVPPALVGLTVGHVFLSQYRLSYPEDFVCAARDTFDLILKDAEKSPR